MREVIDDEKVIMIWVCPNCDDKAEINPTFYQDNGTPMCVDGCDTDMVYLKTEIKKDD
jgi:hypothetical protein